MGRTAGDRNRQAATTLRKSSTPVIGYSYIHSAVDDHSRLAYSEVLTDERKETAAGFWTRANAFFAAHGITVERVLTDNGSCYKAKVLTQTQAAAAGAMKPSTVWMASGLAHPPPARLTARADTPARRDWSRSARSGPLTITGLITDDRPPSCMQVQ